MLRDILAVVMLFVLFVEGMVLIIPLVVLSYIVGLEVVVKHTTSTIADVLEIIRDISESDEIKEAIDEGIKGIKAYYKQ